MTQVQETARARASGPSFATILAFSGPSIPIYGLLMIYAVYLPPYFAGHLGMGLAAVAAVVGIVRIFDLFLDPVLGWLMDRTKTPIGRFRVWMIAGVPIFMVAIWMLFMAPVGVRAPYVAVGLLLFALGNSTLVLSLSAWAANLATSYNDRSRMYGIMQGVGAFGSIATLMIQVVFAKPHPGLPNAIQLTGWFALITLALTGAIVAVSVREPISPTTQRDRFAAKDYWEMISRPEMRRIIFADLALALGPGTTSALYLFFFRDSRHFTQVQAGLLLMVYVVAAFFGGPILGWIATRLNKHRTLMWSTVAYAICQASLFVVPKGSMLWATPGMFGAGFIAAGFLLLIRAMIADVGDEVRLEQGKERMSLLYAMVTTTQKVGLSITVAISYTVLAVVHYNPAEGATNTPAAIQGLEGCYIFAPIIFVLVGGAAFFGYRLDERRHAEIRTALEARDAAAGEATLIEAMAGADGLASAEPEPV